MQPSRTEARALDLTRPLAGPNLDGDAYTALRGDDVLTLNVVTKSRASFKTRALTVGPDYVLERDGETIRIHDFRYRRLLTLHASAKSFTNESLHGHARTRFAFLQNNLSTAGLALGSNALQGISPAALRFAHEHVNGMAHPGDVAYGTLPEPKLAVVHDGDVLTGTLQGASAGDDPPVLSATLSRDGFFSPAHAKSFEAWLAWSGRIHPGAAAAVGETGHIPARIAFDFAAALRKLNPNLSRGQAIEFHDAASAKYRFDIRGWTAKLPAWEPYLPEKLMALMVDAANGTAPNGPKSDEDYIAEMGVLLDTGRYLDAALVGLHASHPYDGCTGEHRARPLCTVMSGMLNTARTDRGVKLMFTGFAQEQQRDFRAAAGT